MNFQHLKIGYVPNSFDLSGPGDRRRFPYFAKTNDVPFKVANPLENYDVILLNGQANLSKWLLYKKKHPETKFIFEMTDSVIFSSDLFRSLFKGTGRFILRRETLLYLNYKTPVKKWLKMADVVICSSKEVKKSVQDLNSNILISLDYLQSEYRFLKRDFSIDDKVKLVWEGLGEIFPHLLHFKDYFEKVNEFCELHIITSEKYPAYGNILKKESSAIIAQFPIETFFHKWEIHTKDTILSECDLGIIPLNKNNQFAWHKPANKLISFWFTGLPALVSGTPAYVDMMDDAGEKLYADTIEEWVAKTNEIKNKTAEERRLLALKNHQYVQEHYSDKVLDKVWEDIFNQAMK